MTGVVAGRRLKGLVVGRVLVGIHAGRVAPGVVVGRVLRVAGAEAVLGLVGGADARAASACCNRSLGGCNSGFGHGGGRLPKTT